MRPRPCSRCGASPRATASARFSIALISTWRRASAAGRFLEYTKALYSKQPEEGSAGLSDDELVQLGTGIGLSDSGFAQCVRAETYSAWMANNTDAAAAKNINETPTLLVKGKPVTATVQALRSAVG